MESRLRKKGDNEIIKGDKLRDKGKVKFGEILINMKDKQWKNRKRFLLTSVHWVYWVYLSYTLLS